jgi:hypothetical protein
LARIIITIHKKIRDSTGLLLTITRRFILSIEIRGKRVSIYICFCVC